MCHGSKLRNAVCTTCKRLKQTNISIYLAVAPRVCLAMCLIFDSFCLSAIFVLYVGVSKNRDTPKMDDL